MAAPTFFQLEQSLNGIIARLARCDDQVANGPKRAVSAMLQQKADIDSIRTDQKVFLDAIAQAAKDNPDSSLYKTLSEKSQEVLKNLDSLSSAADIAIKYIQAIPTE